MTWDAYVFADLSWPMPDPGLVAVWRAMSLDASRWDDWDGFGAATPGGTIAQFVDQVRGAPGAGALELEMGEHGVRLRACFADSGAALWQQLAVAWRLAADIGASGQFAWVPGNGGDVGYRGVIADFSSRWERLAAAELDREPGRKEVDAIAGPRAPTPASKAAPAPAKPAKKAPARAAKKPAAKPAKKSGGKKR
jgi:hypothetical protein